MTVQSSGPYRLRSALQCAQDEERILPFVGIHDLFSATLASQHFDALFLSGFGLAASALDRKSTRLNSSHSSVSRMPSSA